MKRTVKYDLCPQEAVIQMTKEGRSIAEGENESRRHPIFSTGIITSTRIMIKLGKIHKINNVECKTRFCLLQNYKKITKFPLRKQTKKV